MPTFVTIAAFTNPLEAHIAKGRLEAEEIPAFVAHEQQIWNQWHLSDALGGVKLQVFAQHETEAREIVQAHFSGKYEECLPEEYSISVRNTCPRCSSTTIKSRFSYGLVLLMILTLGICGIIFPIKKDIHKCSACKNTWRY